MDKTTEAEKRNLTLSLPYGLVRKAKEWAVREDRSLNAYVREAIEEKIERSSGYKKARDRQLARLGKGSDLGTKGRRPAQRDDLHERA
ncbi:MAG: CopG family transcriptional regulator [Candidatus Aminicenantes bacterium]|nr:CopG family transcriptional regulator [Candidatus Aminicenantes bacterium]